MKLNHECECGGCDECEAPLCPTCTEKLLVSQARTIRRLRALANGYRRKAEDSLYPAMYCDRCETFITTEDTILGVCQIHKTLPLEGLAAQRMARAHAARDVAARERARIVARLRELAATIEFRVAPISATLRKTADTIESEEP